MDTTLIKRIALLASVSLAAVITVAVTPASAQDSGALLDALVRKGILTDQEAEEIRVDLTKEAHTAMLSTVSGGKSTTALAISGRVQVQYAALDNSDSGKNANDGFALRRIYLGASAKLGPNWSAAVNYDFAGDGGFDKAFITWSGDFIDQNLDLTFGLRKVALGYEEFTSSGSLKAIERSAVTRYFVEENNGRRLGAASYRLGAFSDFNPDAAAGKSTGIFYGAAITNAERVDTGGNSGNDIIDDSDYTDASPAFWINGGYSGKFSGGSYTVGAALGYLPDQGGFASAAPFGRGTGGDLALGSLYGTTNIGRFTLAGEILAAKVENGARNGDDASPWGFWIQPSYMLTDKLELVLRYSHVDTDGRGITASDGIKYGPATGRRDKMEEYYAGLNYYFQGNDVKLQFGYVGGKTSGDFAGASGQDETINGIRTQLQVNF
ncbi:porin [Geminisphaera colitermitum]|uniref:porin n=1 Tax=Geminisphaera colitermitum TaxID=1148786 RepID=UPI0001964F42|nr:porin [Geminisphaera colitermitum]